MGIIASYAGEAGDELFESFAGGADTGMLVYKATAYTDRAAGDILIMDGRRYKVASIGNTPDGTAAKVTLTESYAGGMIYEECTGCVTAIDAGGITLTVSRSVTVKVGEGFMVQGYTDINQVFTAKSANTPGDLGVNGLAITLNKGGMNGYPLLRLLHWRVQVLQGLQQRQLRHPEHDRRLNWRSALARARRFGSLSGYKMAT